MGGDVLGVDLITSKNDLSLILFLTFGCLFLSDMFASIFITLVMTEGKEHDEAVLSGPSRSWGVPPNLEVGGNLLAEAGALAVDGPPAEADVREDGD